MKKLGLFSGLLLMMLLAGSCASTSKDSTLTASDDPRAEAARLARENAYDRQAQQESLRMSRIQESNLRTRTKKSP